jgi:hypothetical protein
LAGHAFQVFEGTQSFRGGQRVKGELAHAFQVGVQRVEDLDDLLATADTHA